MFTKKSGLTNVDFNNIDTSKVKYMNNMFAYCSNLRTIKARSQTDIDTIKTNNTRVNSSVKFEIA